jgi:hypothetical protein
MANDHVRDHLRRSYVIVSADVIPGVRDPKTGFEVGNATARPAWTE